MHLSSAAGWGCWSIDCPFLSFTSRSSSRPGPAPGGAEGLLACVRRRSKAARCLLLPVEEGDGIPQRLIDCQRLLREARLRLCISGESQPKYEDGLTKRKKARRTNGRMSLFSPDFESKNDSTLPPAQVGRSLTGIGIRRRREVGCRRKRGGPPRCFGREMVGFVQMHMRCDVARTPSSGTWAGPLISPHNISPQSPIGEGQLLNLRSGESCVLSISSAVWGGHPAEHQTEILHQLDSQQDNANPSRLTVFKAYCIMGYELIVFVQRHHQPSKSNEFPLSGLKWLAGEPGAEPPQPERL